MDVLVDQALGAGRKRGAQVANYKVSWLADCIKAIFKTFQPAAPGLPRVHEVSLSCLRFV